MTKLRNRNRFGLGQAVRVAGLLLSAREALNGSDSEVWTVVARTMRQFAKLFELDDE
ncbi:hypothetical protein EDD93_6006 [Streptomyces sp. 840.1]|nr:hypothetical protein EDD93_6006 [Streptomyces sp. 840.1]